MMVLPSSQQGHKGYCCSGLVGKDSREQMRLKFPTDCHGCAHRLVPHGAGCSFHTSPKSFAADKDLSIELGSGCAWGSVAVCGCCHLCLGTAFEQLVAAVNHLHCHANSPLVFAAMHPQTLQEYWCFDLQRSVLVVSCVLFVATVFAPHGAVW